MLLVLVTARLVEILAGLMGVVADEFIGDWPRLQAHPLGRLASILTVLSTGAFFGHGGNNCIQYNILFENRYV